MKNYLNEIVVHPVKFFVVFTLLLFLLFYAGDVLSQSREVINIKEDSTMTEKKAPCPPCSGCPPCGLGAPAYCCSNKNAPLPVEYRILPKELVESKKTLFDKP